MIYWKKSLNQLWFRVKGLIPTQYLLSLMAIGVFLTLIGSFWGLGWLMFLVYNSLLLLFATLDFVAFRQYPSIKATRHIDHLFELNEKSQVTVQLLTEAPLYTEMWVQDDYPQGFWIDQRTFSLIWKGEKRQTISYLTKPHRRGRHQFQAIHVRIMSKFRLFLFQMSFPNQMAVHVYPSLEPTRKVRKGVYHRQEIEGSTLISTSFGTGREFSHLREYLEDDDSRRINWMATARTGKLVSNIYQPEVGQQVTILLDCGRLMGVQDDGRSRLDIALEAALGFAAIALRQGDKVSFIAFSHRILRFVPSGKGMKHLRKIIDASYDLEPSYIETDYLCAWNLLSRIHKQKTLVALFTEMDNLSFSETIDTMISFTKKKHLVLTISLQDSKILNLLHRIPSDEKEVYEQLVAEELFQERKTTLQKWGNKQLISLDVPPDRLASAVIYKYLDIRSKWER